MTIEEKQKAIDALKKSAPVMAMTQEEFNDYIQTLNKVIDWLEQEPRTIACKDCENWERENNSKYGFCDVFSHKDYHYTSEKFYCGSFERSSVSKESEVEDGNTKPD